MAEGPAHEPLASGSEAYKLRVERLEGIGTSEHHAPPIHISKTKNILLAVLAVVLVFGLIAATASFCLYTIS